MKKLAIVVRMRKKKYKILYQNVKKNSQRSVSKNVLSVLLLNPANCFTDIKLTESKVDLNQRFKDHSNIRITTNEGHVDGWLRGKFEIDCQMNLEHFPRDSHVCPFQVKSTIYREDSDYFALTWGTTYIDNVAVKAKGPFARWDVPWAIPWDIPWYSVSPTESPPFTREVPWTICGTN
jgi:hypothetical protein